MIFLNRNLQEVSNKFLRMLSRTFNISEPSKKIQSWYTLNDAEFFKELEKERKKAFKNETGSTKGYAKLGLAGTAEWEDYVLAEQKKALEIQEQITATDKEIDQMVYELYDLTPKEIAVIEAN